MNMIEQIKAALEAGTPGPWSGHNMVGAGGKPLTPDEIGEYVCNSVKMGKEGQFLFVGGKHEDGGDCDICHTGNGPRGAANTARIARVPDMEAALIAADAVVRKHESDAKMLAGAQGADWEKLFPHTAELVAAYRAAIGAT